MPPRVYRSKKHTLRSGLLLCGWIALTSGLGCAGSGPVAPHPPAEIPDASSEQPAHDPDWSGGQQERLDRLRRALAGPPDTNEGLSVRLAFDGAVDLDLFVTDPLQESVYFANTPTRTGGRLLADRRCDDIDLRVETVHFPAPISGRYRIGVDFHRRCEDSEYSGSEKKEGIYHVRADYGAKSSGAQSWMREGLLIPGQFEVIVLEFDVEAASTESATEVP